MHMKIQLYEYTWYSKLATILFFLLVLPALSFYIGIQYDQTMQVLDPVSYGGSAYPAARQISPRPPVRDGMVSPVATTTVSQRASSEKPYIGSIFPPAAALGSTISLTGSGLGGFEGDAYFFFQRADGKVVRLQGELTTHTTGDAVGAQNVKIALKDPCQPGETIYGDYSGIPAKCDYVHLSPGPYKVFTVPWGNKSNVVDFTIAP